MTRLLTVLSLALAAVAGSAVAQTRPPYPSPGVDPHRRQAEQHRYEMERLRARAEQRESFARQLQLETRLNRLEIEAARQPAPIPPPADRPPGSPEQERALRESATERRRTATAGVTQIDDWLDRPGR